MFRKGFRHVLMAEENGGQGGSGASAAGTTGANNDGNGGGGAAAAGAGNAQTQGGQAGASNSGAAGTAAGSGASASGQSNALAEGAQGQIPSIPEKYQVKKDDGSIDIEASSVKLAEAYGHLEKRLGTGDIPPKSANEYQIAVPDSLKEVFNPKEDQMFQEFLKSAHAEGLTQKQMDFVMGQYFEIAPRLVSGAQQLSADECTAQLKSEWKTDAQYKAEIGKAFKAATGYFGADADYIISTYGNDPRLIRGLAKIGAEMGEDRSTTPPGGAIPGGQSVESLMSSEAYTNPKHADHARVSKQIADYFQAQAAAAEKSGASPIL